MLYFDVQIGSCVSSGESPVDELNGGGGGNMIIERGELVTLDSNSIVLCENRGDMLESGVRNTSAEDGEVALD